MNWKEEMEQAVASLKESAEKLKAAADRLREANERNRAATERLREMNRRLAEANERMKARGTDLAEAVARLRGTAAPAETPTEVEPLELEEPIQPPGSGRYELASSTDQPEEESKTVRHPADPTKLN